MEKECMNCGGSIYFQCRKEAAKYNDRLSSREGASEMLNVSVSSLSNYELGLTPVPTDVVVRMAGLILNVWLGLNMWDYSNMPGNILGQICPQFTLLWFFLSAFGIFLDDLIRWLLFGEEKPHYHLFRKRKGDK